MLDRILFRLSHFFNDSVSGGNSSCATHVDSERARGAALEMPEVFTEVLGPTEQTTGPSFQNKAAFSYLH